MILPEIEIVGVDRLNEVFENLDKSNDKGIRYVLDIANTLPLQQQQHSEDRTHLEGSSGSRSSSHDRRSASAPVPAVRQSLSRPPHIRPSRALSKPRGVLEAARLIFKPSSGVWFNKHKL